MGHIYREKAEIPIPPEGRINHSDGIVSIYYKDGAGRRQKTSIGIATSETTMQPNDNFKFKFAELWKQYYGEDQGPLVDIHAGLYALTLGIGYQTGLYPLILASLGPLYGNAVMDYAMYCIENRSNVAQLFESSMEDRMLFSRKVFSDSWLSDVLSEKISASQLEAFRKEWVKSCVSGGTGKVWLCIDGSNSDSDVSGGELASVGHAKTNRERPVVSYIWAVSAEDGRPVSWFVNNGSMPDCKAVDEAIRFLASSGIGVEGFILDRGFASRDVFELIHSKGLQYVAMLKSNTTGYLTMFDKHYKEIRWNVEYAVDDDVIFGTTDTVPVFTGEPPSCVALFFCGDTSVQGGKKLITTVRNAMRNVREMIDKGLPQISVPEKAAPYIELVKGKDGSIVDARYRLDAWQKTFDSRGYHAVASSKPYSAEQIHRLYRLRDASEKQFSIMKSQLGFSRIRSHEDRGIENRIACAFIASIIRHEIQSACRNLSQDTNVMIKKVSHAVLHYMPGDRYEEIRNIPTNVKKLLGKFGIKEEHFKMFALEVNQQKETVILSPTRVIPELNPKPVKRGRAAKKEESNESDTPKRKRGRPKGSKNKKTIERERLAQEQAIEATEEQPRRKPGRPKGSKNRKTAEQKAGAQHQQETSEEPIPLRRRGRPQGSKNRRTAGQKVETQHQQENAGKQIPQRRPGRPHGSKNKKTLEKELKKRKRQMARRRKNGASNQAVGKSASGGAVSLENTRGPDVDFQKNNQVFRDEF